MEAFVSSGTAVDSVYDPRMSQLKKEFTYLKQCEAVFKETPAMNIVFQSAFAQIEKYETKKKYLSDLKALANGRTTVTLKSGEVNVAALSLKVQKVMAKCINKVIDVKKIVLPFVKGDLILNAMWELGLRNDFQLTPERA